MSSRSPRDISRSDMDLISCEGRPITGGLFFLTAYRICSYLRSVERLDVHYLSLTNTRCVGHPLPAPEDYPGGAIPAASRGARMSPFTPVMRFHSAHHCPAAVNGHRPTPLEGWISGGSARHSPAVAPIWRIQFRQFSHRCVVLIVHPFRCVACFIRWRAATSRALSLHSGQSLNLPASGFSFPHLEHAVPFACARFRARRLRWSLDVSPRQVLQR